MHKLKNRFGFVRNIECICVFVITMYDLTPITVDA